MSRLFPNPEIGAPRPGARALPPAIVAKVGWVNGLAAIRSLGRAGIQVIALDYGRDALGFRSRYVQPMICPDPIEQEGVFLDFLTELASSLAEPVPVFPVNDELLNAIARNRDHLEDRFLCPFPDWSLLSRIQDKRFQLSEAERLGIPAPRSTTDLDSDFVFPVLVKPSDPATFWREFREKSFRCSNPSELKEAFALCLPYGPVVQEFIPGGDDELYTFGSYVARDGSVLGSFCGRKLRQTPPVIGTCRVAESVWIDEVAEQGLAYIRGLGFHGISQVEFKRDPRDGRYKLMEINPRLWQWHGLATATGVNLPLIAYHDLIGMRLPPVRMRGEGRRWAITFIVGTRPTVQKPPYVEAVFARDDIRPAVVYAGRLVRHVIRRARRMARRILKSAGTLRFNR